MAGLPKNGKLCGRDVSTQFVQQFAKVAVIAPPVACCVAWSRLMFMMYYIINYIKYVFLVIYCMLNSYF